MNLAFKLSLAADNLIPSHRQSPLWAWTMPDPAVLPMLSSLGQQEALTLINSPGQYCTAVQGPPGTGKTFLAATALSIRDIEPMGHNENTCDITLIVTETNPVALNIAMAFEKMLNLDKDKRFKLVLEPNVEDWVKEMINWPSKDCGKAGTCGAQGQPLS